MPFFNILAICRVSPSSNGLLEDPNISWLCFQVWQRVYRVMAFGVSRVGFWIELGFLKLNFRLISFDLCESLHALIPCSRLYSGMNWFHTSLLSLYTTSLLILHIVSYIWKESGWKILCLIFLDCIDPPNLLLNFSDSEYLQHPPSSWGVGHQYSTCTRYCWKSCHSKPS